MGDEKFQTKIVEPKKRRKTKKNMPKIIFNGGSCIWGYVSNEMG